MPKEDQELMMEDFVYGLLKTGILGRLRYLMEVITIPEDHLKEVSAFWLCLTSKVFAILWRCLVNSPTCAKYFWECPRLLKHITEAYLSKTGPCNEWVYVICLGHF